MSSPIWNERRWKRNQKLRRREYVLYLRKQNITWPPVVGQLVCDCRFKHVRVVSIDPVYGDVALEDGFNCDLDHCIHAVDHTEDEHPRIAAEFGSAWEIEDEVENVTA